MPIISDMRQSSSLTYSDERISLGSWSTKQNRHLLAHRRVLPSMSPSKSAPSSSSISLSHSTSYTSPVRSRTVSTRSSQLISC